MKVNTAQIKKAGGSYFAKFKTFSLKKKIFITVIIIVLAIVGIRTVSAIIAPPTYTTAIVKKNNITEIVSETGIITAGGRTDIFSPTNGIITEVYVANGDEVIDGQELFKVESSATEQEQQAAYSNYLTAVATLNSAKSNLDVLRSSMYAAWDTYYDLATGDEFENADGTPKNDKREAAEFQIARDDWEAAEAKYKDQQTAVAQASAQVSSTWLLYQATQNAIVKASIAGIISNVAVTTGNSVSIKSPILPATPPVLTISVPSSVEAQVPLSETDIAKVKAGQNATIDVSAVDNKKYKGVVSRVDTIGTDVSGVVRYNSYILISNPDTQLRPGMNADAEIVTNQLEDVLSVPNTSVKPYQGGRAVRVPDGKTKVKYIPVEIGVRGEEFTQILKGLTQGQVIVTSLSNEKLKRPGLFGN
jgi:HlyD family secretion protein